MEENVRIHSLKLTVRPLRICHPERKFHLPTIDFQGLTLSFREGDTILGIDSTRKVHGDAQGQL